MGGLLTRLKTSLKIDSSQRTTIRKNIAGELTTFKLHLHHLVTACRNAVQQHNHVDLVVIVDGLEKLLYVHEPGRNYSNHDELFRQRSEQLKWICSHIIYTVPITLASRANLKNEFSEMLVMPMVQVASPKGVQALRELIARRVDLARVFEQPEAVDELIQLSGGAIRDLMILLRSVTETDGDQITRAEIDYAKQSLKKFYSRQLITLTPEDKAVLRAVHRGQTNEFSDSYARMTYNRIILEYENGDFWQALHPAVLELKAIQNLLNEPA